MITKILAYFKTKREFKKFMRDWQSANKHNSINPLHIFPIEVVTAGNDSYGDLRLLVWNPNIEKLIIGNYVSIASNVTFILGGNHHTKTLMTYPSCLIGPEGQKSFTKGEIKIDDDVWIGHGSIILSGITIGQGAVIGAGSVVAMDIPPYAIAVGNPIQIVKYRFPPNIIEKLVNLDYKNFDKEKAKLNIHLLNQPINNQSNWNDINELFSIQ
jgi:virginiamycin A acetyltransferase